MPRGGKLTIETGNVHARRAAISSAICRVTPGDYVMLAVSDTGVGMDEATCRRHLRALLHDQRRRARAPGSAWRPSTASSSRAAATSGVYSEPGAGSTFKIYLPQVAGERRRLAIERSAEPRRDAARAPKPCCWSRTTKPCACWRASRSSVPAIGSCRRAIRRRPMRAGRRVRGPDSSAAERRHHAGIGRAAACSIACARLHPGLRVLYMSGYADEAVVRHGVLRRGHAVPAEAIHAVGSRQKSSRSTPRATAPIGERRRLNRPWGSAASMTGSTTLQKCRWSFGERDPRRLVKTGDNRVRFGIRVRLLLGMPWNFEAGVPAEP